MDKKRVVRKASVTDMISIQRFPSNSEVAGDNGGMMICCDALCLREREGGDITCCTIIITDKHSCLQHVRVIG